MKKLLMSSFALLMFALSMFLFQASCKKEAVAETTNTVTYQPLGYFLYEKSSRVINSAGVNTDVYQFWLANYDGTNQHQIPVTLPSTVSNYGNSAHLSPDGKRLFIYAHELISAMATTPYTTRFKDHIYVCNIDGTGLTDIVSSDVTTNYTANTVSAYGIAGIDGAY